MSRLLVLLAATGCAVPAGPEAKVWTPREFSAKRAADPQPDFGGWKPNELIVTEGTPIPFSTDTQGSGEGLTVFPGVSDRAAIGFVITDLWRDSPEPWVQPVWVPATLDMPPVRRTGRPNIFPMGLDSTFYSPWWVAQMVQVSDAQVEALRDARSVLLHRVTPPGPLVLCPVIEPASVTIASVSANDAPRHPLTRRALERPDKATALVDGDPVTYLDFGMGRAPFEGQRLVESDLFVFVRGGKALPVAAIWPSNAFANGFLRRVEVELPEGAAFFVPSNRQDLRTTLGVLAPDVDASLDRFPEYGLRAVRNPACFSTPAAFPQGCEWLDAQDVIRRVVPVERFKRTTVQLTAAVLRELPP